MIDPHVHLRDWSQNEKETLSHGLGVALTCGIDEVFDMPNTQPALTERESILRRLKDAEQCGLGVRYHLYAGVTSSAEQIRRVVSIAQELFPQVVGLKLFAGHSTGNMGLIKEREQSLVYRTLKECGYEGVVALHCEKESLLHPELYDPADFSTHSLARPVEAEVASVSDQLQFSQEEGFRGHLHICHLSSIEALHEIEKARMKGVRVSCAVTPHHALLSSEDAKERTLYAKMNPPLRSETERSTLFAALLEGRVDWIESDHAPHTLRDKEAGASGIPGFSGILLLVKRLLEQGATRPLLEQLLGRRVQEVFKLPIRDVFVPAYDDLESLSLKSAAEYPWDSYRNLRLR